VPGIEWCIKRRHDSISVIASSFSQTFSLTFTFREGAEMGKLSRGYITKVRGLARRLARGLCKGGGKYLRHCEVLYIRTRSQSQGANK